MHTHGRPVKEVEYNLDMERIPHSGLKNTLHDKLCWTTAMNFLLYTKAKVQKPTLNYKILVMHRLTSIVARAGPPYRPREERYINLHSESIRNQHHTKAAEGGTTRKDKPLEQNHKTPPLTQNPDWSNEFRIFQDWSPWKSGRTYYSHKKPVCADETKTPPLHT